MRLIVFLLLLAVGGCAKAPHQVVPPITFDGAAATDTAGRRSHGERLVHVLGCTGCHGAHLEGTFFTKETPQYGPLYASNLTVEVPKYTDAQLDGIIRNGTHPERNTVWAMPSQIFHNLSDADLKNLIVYMRSLRPMGAKLPPPKFSVQDKKDIAGGNYKAAAQMVHDFASKQPIDLGPRYALGRYIASTTCEECHGSDLAGTNDPMGKTPDLVIAGSYGRAQFERLITQGIPTPARKLNPMMSGVASTRFTHFTKHERDALYAYLQARADRRQ